MIELKIQIGREISPLLMFPRISIEKMFDIGNVIGAYYVLQASIVRNFKAQKNIDGSNWEPWSDYTAALRAKGIVKLHPKRMGTGKLLIATGEYYHRMAYDMLGMTSSVVMKDDLYGDDMRSVYTFSEDRVPQIANEWENHYKGNKNPTPRRQVMFWDNESIRELKQMVLDNIDKYWSGNA